MCLLFICIITRAISAKVYRLPVKKTSDNYWMQGIFKETVNQKTLIWTYDFKQLEPDIIKEIVTRQLNSTVTEKFDLTTLRKTPNPRLQWTKFFSSRRVTKSIHVIILKETESLNHSCSVLMKTISQLNRVSTRPKTLIVIYGIKAYSSLNTFVKKLLLEAWEKKFLDLTLIYVQHKSRPILTYYQPFKRTIYRMYLSRNTTLFPNKLKDMNGRKFVIAAYKNWKIASYEEARRYDPFFLASLTPGNYVFVKHMFCKAHNCTAVLVQNSSKSHEPNIYICILRRTQLRAHYQQKVYFWFSL